MPLRARSLLPLARPSVRLLTAAAISLLPAPFPLASRLGAAVAAPVQLYGSKGVFTLRLSLLMADSVETEAEARDVLAAHLARVAAYAKAAMERKHRIALHCELKPGVFGLLSQAAAAQARAQAGQQRAARRQVAGAGGGPARQQPQAPPPPTDAGAPGAPPSAGQFRR